MLGPKVVQFDREGWRDAVAALRAIADQIESGELPRPDTGAMVTIGEDGVVDTFGFGRKADDLSVLGLLRVGEQAIIDGCLGEE